MNEMEKFWDRLVTVTSSQPFIRFTLKTVAYWSEYLKFFDQFELCELRYYVSSLILAHQNFTKYATAPIVILCYCRTSSLFIYNLYNANNMCVCLCVNISKMAMCRISLIINLNLFSLFFFQNATTKDIIFLNLDTTFSLEMLEAIDFRVIIRH